ncbi:MAG: ATP-binding protein [Synergistaceae bacterium]|jgi:predicted AAA+ superfamily ATPase|nr:ATP-binding protein [Synergistaceae bacterium]
MYIDRVLEKDIVKSLEHFPVTVITGPRQCGKSTLARKIMSGRDDAVYLDLERPSDLAKLAVPEMFFSSKKGSLICIDEMQRCPDLFPLVRSLVDEWGKNGAFLFLGSAPRDLQSSETLAGRVSYYTLTPFLWREVKGAATLEQYLSRGGFPGSLLAEDEETSALWRENFIATFLERDLLQWLGSSPGFVRRLWRMLAHLNGQMVNYSSLASSLGVSDKTVRSHIDMLASAFMLHAVPAYRSNMGKRLVKTPKIYLSDSGIASSLLGIGTYDDLLGHPTLGAVWEQVVLANVIGCNSRAEVFHYRTKAGAEMDFVVENGPCVYAVECKASPAPKLTKGTYAAIQDIRPKWTYVAMPGEGRWPFSKGVDAISLDLLSEDGAFA